VVNSVQLDANLSRRLDRALDQVKEKLIHIVAAAPLLVIAIAIVLLAMWFGRVIASRPAHWLGARSHNPYLAELLARVVQTVVVLLGILLALNLLGATALVGRGARLGRTWWDWCSASPSRTSRRTTSQACC
jgi:hypothetical protein